MSPESSSPEPRSARQTFLTGPMLYLRPVELSDAATATIWRPTRFPLPVEVVEDQLKEQLEVDPDDEEANQQLIVCRRDDDRVVGSVRVRRSDAHLALIYPHINPLLSEVEQDAISAEVASILVPWLIGESNVPSVIVESMSARPAFEAAVAELGGRLVCTMRERYLVRGQRRDRLFFQFLHPGWLSVLGAPPEAVAGEAVLQASSPAPFWGELPALEHPSQAIAVGDRIYLRPFKPEEGALVSQWTLEDPEIYYNEGRFVFNPVSYGHLHKTLAEKEVPSWIRFAIVLRETDELIGANGLDNIDWVSKTAETETEVFRPQHRGAGFGTEAKHLMLDYGFERLGLHMIYSFVDERNARSQAALRKQGYRDAGYLAWVSFGNGSMLGVHCFDLLATEWRAARESGNQRTGD